MSFVPLGRGSSRQCTALGDASCCRQVTWHVRDAALDCRATRQRSGTPVLHGRQQRVRARSRSIRASGAHRRARKPFRRNPDRPARLPWRAARQQPVSKHVASLRRLARCLRAAYRSGLQRGQVQPSGHCVSLPAAASQAPAELSVTVEKAPSNTRRLYASVQIAAPLAVVWRALTSYDDLDTFIPGTLLDGGSACRLRHRWQREQAVVSADWHPDRLRAASRPRAEPVPAAAARRRETAAGGRAEHRAGRQIQGHCHPRHPGDFPAAQ